MKKALVAAALAVGMVMALAPMASAVVGTNPVASPDTIYPYVNAGRADVTTITFDSVLDSHLSVFDEWGTQVYQKNAGTESVTWGGQQTGGGLVGPGTYQACIYNDGDDPGTPLEGFCDSVTVVHHDDYFWVTRSRNGKAAVGGGMAYFCQVTRGHIAMRIKCAFDSALRLRYLISPPALTSEQTLAGSTGSSVDSIDYRGNVSNVTTNVGVRVVTTDGYWGKVRKVHKSFLIHEEY